MSTPRCLRIAIETCRPSKSTSLPLRTKALRSQAPRLREFSSNTPRCTPTKDITAGFPMPEIGSRKIQGLGVVEDSDQPIQNDQEPQAPSAASLTTNGKTAGEQEGLEISSSKPELSSHPSTTPGQQPPRSHSVLQDIMEEASKKGPHSRASSTSETSQSKSTSSAASETKSKDDSDVLDINTLNVPPNVLAAFRTAIRHSPTHGIPVASLQMRSYSVRNLEFFADFAVRAAYWLNLPVSGPVPLPKKIERWTVPKSPFIFKKTMENFERITRRRLLTVYDGDPSVVEVWLAFLRKWQFYGVGMKANVWSYEGLDVGKSMDKQFQNIEKELDEKLKLFGFAQAAAGNKDLLRMMLKQGVRGPGVGATDVRDKSRVGEASTEADVI